MRWNVVLIAAVLLGIDISVCQAAPKKNIPNPEQKDSAFDQLFTSFFSQWDVNHDGKLDLKEIDAIITNPSVHGNEAAIAVVVRRHLLRDEEIKTNELTLQEMLSMANDAQVQHAVNGAAWHIQEINHYLFLPDDPNLFAFHQGGMGDCYLLAVIGAFVYHNPQAVRTMIKSSSNGNFDVHFGNGKNVTILPVTDAELIMGASEGKNHGIWLSVLEKAFAENSRLIKEEKTGNQSDDAEAVVNDLIGHGGYYSPVIKLFTGHKTAGAPMARWLKDDPQNAIEKMNVLLTKLSTEHRLMIVATGGNKTKMLPKGIPHGHILAVLDYDSGTQKVKMFNPWGNHHEPNGPSGPINGYSTNHGIFEVPIGEFMEIFSGFTYETEKAMDN